MVTTAPDETIQSAMRHKALLAGLVLLLILVAASVHFVMRRNAEEKAREQAKAEQKKTEQAAANADILLSGVIGALELINVPVPVSGVVKAFHAEVGTEVYEGQLLAEIQNAGLETAQEHAMLELEKAQNRVNDLESAISAARLEASRANADAIRSRSEFDKAERHYTRQKLLYAEGATPRNTYEKAEQDYKALAEESRSLTEVAQKADERVSALTRDLDAARKLLEGRVADQESSKVRVEAGQIISPVSGLITSRRGDAGTEVNPTMNDLFQIATDTSKLIVTAEPSPDQIERIKPGQPVLVSVADIPQEMLSGLVISTENGKVKIEFGNPSPLVKPGQTAQIRIVVRQQPASPGDN